MSSRRDEDDDDDDGAGAAPVGSQRLDRWLWFTRIVKSRTLAAKFVADGKVRVNRVRVDKPSYALKPGDVLTTAIHRTVRVIQVVALGQRRGPASEAQALYADLTPRAEPGGGPGSADREAAARPTSDNGHEDAGAGSVVQRDVGSGRPTKRDRRQLDTLRRR